MYLTPFTIISVELYRWCKLGDTNLIGIQLLCSKDGLFIPHVWRQASGPSLLPTSSASGRVDMSDMKNRDKRKPEPKRRSGVGLPQGAFGPHYNGSIWSFSPLWIEAPLTMSKGCRSASCQVVSTPFGATLWPTATSLLGLHSSETGFCRGQVELLMGDNSSQHCKFGYIYRYLSSIFSCSVLGEVQIWIWIWKTSHQTQESLQDTGMCSTYTSLDITRHGWQGRRWAAQMWDVGGK